MYIPDLDLNLNKASRFCEAAVYQTLKENVEEWKRMRLEIYSINLDMQAVGPIPHLIDQMESIKEEYFSLSENLKSSAIKYDITGKSK